MTLYYVEYQCFCIYLLMRDLWTHPWLRGLKINVQRSYGLGGNNTFFFHLANYHWQLSTIFFFVTMNCHIEYISAF